MSADVGVYGKLILEINQRLKIVLFLVLKISWKNLKTL